jgi:hypothetical protein
VVSFEADRTAFDYSSYLTQKGGMDWVARDKTIDATAIRCQNHSETVRQCCLLYFVIHLLTCCVNGMTLGRRYNRNTSLDQGAISMMVQADTPAMHCMALATADQNKKVPHFLEVKLRRLVPMSAMAFWTRTFISFLVT